MRRGEPIIPALEFGLEERGVVLGIGGEAFDAERVVGAADAAQLGGAAGAVTGLGQRSFSRVVKEVFACGKA